MYDKIPEDLKTKPNWVNVWNNSKIPMQTSIRKSASSSDQGTWGSFELAVSNVIQGKYDGIGYVFDGDGIIGIDIDDGFSDGFLSGLSIDIMKRCHSYTEKSRSGRGVHILLRGDLPFHGKNNLAGVEIYKARRFFIMTGQQMIFPDIVENQEAIDYIVGKYFTATEKVGGKPTLVQKIYSPAFKKPEGSKVFVRPDYPVIMSGGRNLSLTSLAGAMHNTGYTKAQIYEELCTVNKQCCKPPLHEREIETICESVTRYRR